MNKYSGDAKLNPILNNLKDAKNGTFKRPDHPDFMTSAELKAIQFSGMRDHRMAMEFELWVVGEMARSITYREVQKDPYALSKAQVEYFGLTS